MHESGNFKQRRTDIMDILSEPSHPLFIFILPRSSSLRRTRRRPRASSPRLGRTDGCTLTVISFNFLIDVGHCHSYPSLSRVNACHDDGWRSSSWLNWRRSVVFFLSFIRIEIRGSTVKLWMWYRNLYALFLSFDKIIIKKKKKRLLNINFICSMNFFLYLWYIYIFIRVIYYTLSDSMWLMICIYHILSEE